MLFYVVTNAIYLIIVSYRKIERGKRPQNTGKLVEHFDQNMIVTIRSSLPYFETSAVTGQNVDRAIETLLEAVMSRMQRAVEGSEELPQRRRRSQLRLGSNVESIDKPNCSC